MMTPKVCPWDWTLPQTSARLCVIVLSVRSLRFKFGHTISSKSRFFSQCTVCAQISRGPSERETSAFEWVPFLLLSSRALCQDRGQPQLYVGLEMIWRRKQLQPQNHDLNKTFIILFRVFGAAQAAVERRVRGRDAGGVPPEEA